MSDVTFLFYSHSDYSDLWDIIRDKSTLIPEKYKRFIAINSNSSIKPIGFDNIITYDDSLNYSDKVLSVLQQIPTEYVAFIHDNDLIMSFSDEVFTDLISTIKTHKIDRCMFGVIGRDNGNIKLTHFNLVNSINTQTLHFRAPYDVGPSIWRVEAFKAALEHIPNTSYRDIEDSPIQEYCTTKLNVYGFSSDDKHRAYYAIGRPFSEPFQFLHIFVRGKMFEPYVYMDQEANFIALRNKYPILSKRETYYNQTQIATYFRTV